MQWDYWRRFKLGQAVDARLYNGPWLDGVVVAVHDTGIDVRIEGEGAWHINDMPPHSPEIREAQPKIAPGASGALHAAGRMCVAMDKLVANFGEPDRAGAALCELLEARRDYDRAIIDEMRTKDEG